MKNRNLGFQKALGEHIKKLRLEVKWVQAQLASVSHIDETQISRIEHGVQAPNLQSLVAISAALGKQPYELLKINFEVKVNTDFNIHHRKASTPDTTNVIRKLTSTDFLRIPRSVAEIIQQCKKTDQVILKSAATSGVLKKLTDDKVLKRVKVGESGRFRYQLRKKGA